jgi:hypothetical protein
MNEETVGGVLIGSELHFHCPELNAPTNLAINWDFQSNRVPVGAVEHLEQNKLFDAHFLELPMDNQVIPLEDVSDMISHFIVYFDFILLRKLLYPCHILLLDSSKEVVVLFLIPRIVPKVIVSFIVS